MENTKTVEGIGSQIIFKAKSSESLLFISTRFRNTPAEQKMVMKTIVVPFHGNYLYMEKHRWEYHKDEPAKQGQPFWFI
jgi:hypothetical protein